MGVYVWLLAASAELQIELEASSTSIVPAYQLAALCSRGADGRIRSLLTKKLRAGARAIIADAWDCYFFDLLASGGALAVEVRKRAGGVANSLFEALDRATWDAKEVSVADAGERCQCCEDDELHLELDTIES